MLVLRIAHRIWKETKQDPGTAGPGNMLGCCLISFHFLWAILSTSTVLQGQDHGQGHLEVVRALLQHPQIDPNKGMKSNAATALYYASDIIPTTGLPEPDYVRLIIANPKTDVNKGLSTDGRTPLIRQVEEEVRQLYFSMQMS